MITFGDAVNADHIPFDYAALYNQDCSYPCPTKQANRWDISHRRWITFKGNPHASIIDFEPGTRDYQDPVLLRDWLKARARDRKTRSAWIYSDLANAALAAHWARGMHFHWWIPTGDRVRRSQAELSALLKDHGVPASQAAPDLIAAHQMNGVTTLYDENVCWNWSH